MNMQLENSRCGREWKKFIDRYSKAMFQTALLLAANPRGAEAALITSMDELDISRPPETHDLPIWEETVVKLSVGTPEMLSTEGDGSLACSLLQPALRPVIQLDRLPRICFVLQLLLGYTTEACAAVLGVKESEVPVLVAEAATKLPQTIPTVANCRR
jgi:DNA-directed RNA polymerase specialized sigma24 family protein